MKIYAIASLALILAACSGETTTSESSGCNESSDCDVGQTCDSGACVETATQGDADASDPSNPSDPIGPTTDASWPADIQSYTSSHLSLVTSLELSSEPNNNQFGDLLRFLATQADVAIEGYFADYIANGEMVTLIDHQGIAVTTDPQAFLMSHLSGDWAPEMTWESMLDGSGSVTLHSENYGSDSAVPLGAFESASLIDGVLNGFSGNLLLNIPEGNILSTLDVHETMLSANSVSLSNEGIGYEATLTGWVSVAEFYESLNRAFEKLCACAGIGELENVWNQTQPGIYECDPMAYDTDACAGTENEALCTQAIPLCSTLIYVIRGDLDKDPNIPDEDAMSVILDIETTSVSLTRVATTGDGSTEPAGDGS